MIEVSVVTVAGICNSVSGGILFDMPHTSIICAIPFPSRLITMHTPTATAIVNNTMFTRRDRCGHSAGTSQTDGQTGQTDNGPIA